MRVDRHKGFITIATVLVLLAIAVAAALAAFAMSWQTTDTQAAWARRAAAQSMADACIEHARAELWQSPGYGGNDSLTYGEGQCHVLPIAVSSGSYQVRAEGDAADVLFRTETTLQLTVDASGSVQSVSGAELRPVTDF